MVLIDGAFDNPDGFKRSKRIIYPYQQWNFNPREDRKAEYEKTHVSEERKRRIEFLVHSLDKDLFLNFLRNFNIMVIVHIALAIIATFIFQTFRITFDFQVAILITPIVFPLAFSINTDFQRREKVLEDLAVFKSSCMLWSFCVKQWNKAAQSKEPENPEKAEIKRALIEYGKDWMNEIDGLPNSLLFNLREYLFMKKTEKDRDLYQRFIYEDFCHANVFIEYLRQCNLHGTPAIVSRSVHLLNSMCLSFERLKTIKEYKSPRSIRSFTKIYVLILPIILSPYFVYLGVNSQQPWQPYFIATLVGFLFSTLQSVQDKLDDPFSGESKDVVRFDTIDKWRFGAYEHAGLITRVIKKTPEGIPLMKNFTQTVYPEIKSDPVITNVAETIATNIRTDKSPEFKRGKFNRDISFIIDDEYEQYLDKHKKLKKIAPLLEEFKGDTRITISNLQYGKPIDLYEERSDNQTPSTTDSESDANSAINNSELIEEPKSLDDLFPTESDSVSQELDNLNDDGDESLIKHIPEYISSVAFYNLLSSQEKVPVIDDSTSNTNVPDDQCNDFHCFQSDQMNEFVSRINKDDNSALGSSLKLGELSNEPVNSIRDSSIFSSESVLLKTANVQGLIVNEIKNNGSNIEEDTCIYNSCTTINISEPQVESKDDFTVVPGHDYSTHQEVNRVAHNDNHIAKNDQIIDISEPDHSRFLIAAESFSQIADNLTDGGTIEKEGTVNHKPFSNDHNLLARTDINTSCVIDGGPASSPNFFPYSSLEQSIIPSISFVGIDNDTKT